MYNVYMLKYIYTFRSFSFLYPHIRKSLESLSQDSTAYFGCIDHELLF